MEKVEALDLLEESWFFENLFDRRARMLRCYSCIRREDKVEAKKSNDGNMKLDRQLSLQTSKTSYKVHDIREKKTNVKRWKPPRNQEVEATSNVSEMRFRQSNPKRMLRKRQSDLAFQELQGFKDLGFTFDNKDLSPDVVNILPGLQGNQTDELKQDKVGKPYLSQTWLLPPPIPAYVSKNSAEDMKAQIKFWARAVVMNVRQEC